MRVEGGGSTTEKTKNKKVNRRVHRKTLRHVAQCEQAHRNMHDPILGEHALSVVLACLGGDPGVSLRRARGWMNG